MTEQILMENEHRETSHFIQRIIDTTPNITYVYDLIEKRNVYTSQRCSEILGYSPEEIHAMGASLFEKIMHPNDMARIAEHRSLFTTATDDDVLEVEYRVRHSNGEWRWLRSRDIVFSRNADGSPKMIRGSAENITRQHQFESRLRQTQKMEALGTLAGGIAHDFNNILGIIIGYTEMARDDSPEESPLNHQLERILESANRAKDLVKQILLFSRSKGDDDRIPVQVSAIIKEAVKFIRATLPSTIEIHQAINSSTSTILADPVQIHQVLINLCTNAANAMRYERGTLEISMNDVDIDSETAILCQDLKPGPYLKLTVSDTGHGMDHDTQEKIFDPYFTTQNIGKGSGLGLAVVHGIVMRMNGAIAVRSELGNGTAFDIYLPRIVRECPLKIDYGTPVRGLGERILVIDDEPNLAAMWRATLERIGYQTTSKTDSTEALEVFRSQPDRFDLIVTDYTMPGLTGEQVAAEAIRIKPDVPIILCTGSSDRIEDERAKSVGIRSVIMKPLTIRQMAEVVRVTLDRKEPPSRV